MSEFGERMRTELPPEMNEVNNRLIKELERDRLASKGPQTEDSLNDFQKNFNFLLPDAQGKFIAFSDLIEKGPLVLSFYRGGWCPYCNLELKVLKSESTAFKKLGAQLVAISPNSPDKSLTIVEKENLDFVVLSDTNNEVAKSLGISYVVPEYLLKTFAGFGLDLSKHYDRKKVELPMPATYVIDQDLVVRYSFASEDFTKRAKIARILESLEKIQAGK